MDTVSSAPLSLTPSLHQTLPIDLSILSLHPYLFWIGFHILIFALLALDLGLFQRKPHGIKIKEALLLSSFWIAIALAFNGFLYYVMGEEVALQFLTGYLVEKSLSIDNLFVFVAIFTYFKVSVLYQHKVLYWGILGALVLRIVLILAGISLISQFHWISYLLGVFLVVTGIKFALQKTQRLSLQDNWLVRLFQRFFPVSEKKGSGDFFVRERGKWKMTQLFIVLLVLESTDVMFALDSIPAVFAITTDPFIVYTSNVFAILGLRTLHFVLVHFLDRLHYLKFGLSAILVFIGFKMLIAPLYTIPLLVSLFVILLLLAIIIGISFSASKTRTFKN